MEEMSGFEQQSHGHAHGEGGDKDKKNKDDEMVIVVRTVINAKSVGVDKRVYHHSEFYRVDLNRDEGDEEAVSKCWPPLMINSGLVSMLRLKSFIYIIGYLIDDPETTPESLWLGRAPGENEYPKPIPCLKGVSWLDLSKPSKRRRWNVAANPSYRDFVMCVALCGKIYGLGSSSEFHRPQVYDHASGTGRWDDLALPPEHIMKYEMSYRLIPDPPNSRILVHLYDPEDLSNSSIYAFYPDSNRWDCVAPDYHGWDLPSAFVDGDIIFVLSLDSLLAYHLPTNKHIEIVWSQPCPRHVTTDIFRETACLVYLGNGLLCLYSYACTLTPSGIRLTFSLFQFERSSSTVIIFTYRFTKSFLLPGVSDAVEILPLGDIC